MKLIIMVGNILLHAYFIIYLMSCWTFRIFAGFAIGNSVTIMYPNLINNYQTYYNCFGDEILRCPFVNK